MHFHFPLTTVEILWTLTFAAQLVLLVVLIGRERLSRFPWFTASIVVLALRLLVGRVLIDRLPRLTFGATMIVLADISVLIGLLVLTELARRSFRGASRSIVLIAALAILAIGAVAAAWWAPWPTWKSLTANPKFTALLLMQLGAQRGEVLLDLLAVEFGIVVAAFGRGFGAGWRSHAQRIAIGLSTAGLTQLAVERIVRTIADNFVPKSREEYEHVLRLVDHISNAPGVVTIVVLVWWIVCLWIDEPAPAASAGSAPVKEFPETPDQSGTDVEVLSETSAASGEEPASSIEGESSTPGPLSD